MGSGRGPWQGSTCGRPSGLTISLSVVPAYESGDRPQVRGQLAELMDAVTTDGIYGRELLQLAMRLPTSVYPVFDHLSSARTKLGAANRAGAAAKLEQLRI